MAYDAAMSYPVAIPDRRLMARRACAQPCLVYFGSDPGVPAVLRQLDGLGARLRLVDPPARTPRDVRIVMDDGSELFGAAAWRIGDHVGVRRQTRAHPRR